MGKKISTLTLIILLLVLLPFQACRKKDDSGVQAVSYDGPPAGDLKINFMSPIGKTENRHEADQIVVIFEKPMVELKVLPAEKSSSFLKIQPTVTGKYRWMGTKTLTFTPDRKLPVSTEFKIIVPAGIRSVDNYLLKNDWTWTFQTILPRLIEHYPANKQNWIKPDTSILLIFNQAVDPKKCRDFLSLIEAGADKEETVLDFSLNNPNEKKLKDSRIKTPPDRVLLLQPKRPMKPGFSYYVEIKAGLYGKEGHLGMAKGRLFTFDIYKKFEFIEMVNKSRILPTASLNLRFTNPVNYKEFAKRIKFEPSVPIPDYYLNWEYSQSTIWLNLPFQPDTDYSVVIEKELTDKFNNTLNEEIKLKFSTSSYPPSVWMTQGHGILESYGDLKYPVFAINSEKIVFQAANVPKDRVIPLLKTNKIFSSYERFDRKNFFQVDKLLTLDLPRNKRKIYPLEIKDLLTEDSGLIFVQLDTLTEEKYNRFPKVFLQVTNLGISAKFSPDNNLIWVTELKSGLPLDGALVEIRDNNNRVKWRGQTDKEGKVESPGWKPLKIKSTDKWSKPEQWIFVQKDKDTAFLSSEWGTGIYPYRFGIDYDWNPIPETLHGYIFTDRGIYRAGEEVHLKGIIREQQKGEWQQLSNRKIKCTILDPFSKKVFEKHLRLDDYSSFALDFKTNTEAALGYYSVRAEIQESSSKMPVSTIYASFRVEAFRPAEFEVLLYTPQKSFVFGDKYKAEVNANYMFGGAMADQKIKWHLRLNPSRFSPPGHKGFIFGNQIDYWERFEGDQSRLLASGESVLDKNGTIQINAKLLAEKEKDSMSASLEATVTGPSRRSLSSRINTIIHRGEYYIGLRPNTSFLKKGDEYTVEVISVEPSGELVAGKKILLTLFKREWHSVKKEEMGGRFRWVTEKKDIEIDQKKITTRNMPDNLFFPVKKAGFYIIVSESTDSRGNPITTSTYFYSTGDDYIPWERQDDDAVELIPDSTSYNPGDTAKILVKSPYEKAKALITIEREFVIDSRVVDIVGSSSQIDIPIQPGHIPNIFVSVLLVQGRTYPEALDKKEDLGKPSFKIGYVKLNVDSSERRLSIETTPDKDHYKPGENVTIRLKVKNWKKAGIKASLSIAVVDLGVLSLIGFQTPDPFTSFNQQKPLSVQSSEIRQHLVGQRVYGEKGDDEGGGAGSIMRAKAPGMSEIELRGNFKFTAYWNPSVVTDENGDAQVDFTLPDNLTTFRIMAVAQTKDSRFGRGETTFRVSKPLLLQAALPRFARVGDHFQGGIVIQNHSDKKYDVSVTCEADGILLQEKNVLRTISLEPGEGHEVLYDFLAENPGEASFAFRAKMGDETDGLEIKIPVTLPRPTETVALSDKCLESKEEKINIPENVYISESRLAILGSSSALTGLKGNVDFLYRYPYPCLEQRLSSILPFIVGMEVIADFKLSPLSKIDIQKHVQKNIKEIYSYQKESGGFGLWPDSQRESPFNSCYAAFVLAEAEKAGYDVDSRKIGSLINYLKNIIRGRINNQSYPYPTRIWSTSKAYALYALALLGKPEPAFAEKLYKEREALSLFGQTLLLKALYHGKGSLTAQATLLQELMNKIKVTANLAHFEDDEGRSGRWIYSSNMRTTALSLQALIETGSDHPLVHSIARWLVEKRKTKKWMTTQENVYVFYALNSFYTKYENVQPDFSIDISLAGKRIIKDIFKNDRSKVVQSELSISSLKPGKTVPFKIKKKGNGTFYYDVRMSYAPKGELPPRDEGFTIIKEYTSMDGKPLETIKAGSLVVVNLKIVVPKESLYVVVDDPLPAGLEAVNPTFVTESQEQQRQLSRLSNKNKKRWWRGFNHIEMHDDRILLFADSLAPGIHTHQYLARALTFGTFHAPGSKIEEMYSPEIFGRSPEWTLRIHK